ncbi:MSMEG_0570 family nitrogen starvation response protein [Acinetobacter baumannii]
MPSVNFTVKWPNGEHVQYYSPSTVIYDYLVAGESYPAAHFFKQAENGLNAASERVRARYGFACSSAMDSLATIKRQAQIFAVQADEQIEITEMSKE